MKREKSCLKRDSILYIYIYIYIYIYMSNLVIFSNLKICVDSEYKL